MPLARFTRQDLLCLIDFIQTLSKCQTRESLETVIWEICQICDVEECGNGYCLLNKKIVLHQKTGINSQCSAVKVRNYLSESRYDKESVAKCCFAGEMLSFKDHIPANKVVQILIDRGSAFDGGEALWENGGLFGKSSILNNPCIDDAHISFLNILATHFHLACQRVQKRPQKISPFLSKRESEVLSWVKKGKTNWEISVILKVSQNTVKFHIRNILRKLGAANRQHAIAITDSFIDRS
jgi:DNA-binding CsgD family transcriptional regulator